jgi:hypothetical protein
VTYKEDTHFSVFDPAVRVLAEWHPRMALADDVLVPLRTTATVCAGADALAIMTPWPPARSSLRPTPAASVGSLWSIRFQC